MWILKKDNIDKVYQDGGKAMAEYNEDEARAAQEWRDEKLRKCDKQSIIVDTSGWDGLGGA